MRYGAPDYHAASVCPLLKISSPVFHIDQEADFVYHLPVSVMRLPPPSPGGAAWKPLPGPSPLSTPRLLASLLASIIPVTPKMFWMFCGHIHILAAGAKKKQRRAGVFTQT